MFVVFVAVDKSVDQAEVFIVRYFKVWCNILLYSMQQTAIVNTTYYSVMCNKLVFNAKQTITRYKRK